MENKSSQNILELLTAAHAQDIATVHQTILNHIECDQELVNHIGKYLIENGGKHLRPLFVVMCARMLGYEGNLHIMLGAAIEFIHTATLLHDDVVDESLMRRFKPSVNAVWGSKASILIGDYLFTQAFDLMTQVNVPEASKCLAEATAMLTKGEVHQLARLRDKADIDQNEYYRIIDAKTAALFAAACRVAAILAGRDANTQEQFRQFGMLFGRIFQVQDDMLDYLATSSAQLGKNIGDDFFEGKLTLPVILLRQCGDDVIKSEIQQMFFQKKNTEDNLYKIIKYMKQYAIQDKVMVIVHEIIQDGLRVVESMQIAQGDKDSLSELLQYAIKRMR